MTNLIASKTILTAKNGRRKTSFIICLLSLIFLQAFYAQAVKKIEANPIHVAVSLTQEVDSAAVASTCEYYGYINQPSQDGYEVYRHPNGSIIRYKYTNAENGKRYPTIEVKSKATQKEKDHILKHLRFQKCGNSYQRKSISYITTCSFASGDILRFSNQPKS